MKGPLVSVILPTHDRVELLRCAVRSVQAQTEADFELIIVDDASSDATGAYLKGLAAQDARVRVLSNAESKGGAGARNVGLAESRGEWIAFLDDDDEWLPEKLARQLLRLRRAGDAVACSCSYIVRASGGAGKRVRVPDEVPMRPLLVYNLLGGASVCVCSARALRAIGGFDSRFRSAQDHDLWIRLRQAGRIVACPEALVIYRAHASTRITNDMRLQHLGARRFYFKYRRLMDGATRRRRLAYSCYLMSRDPTRALPQRARYLLLSVLNASATHLLPFASSSLPRLVRDAVWRGGGAGRARGQLGASAPRSVRRWR